MGNIYNVCKPMPFAPSVITIFIGGMFTKLPVMGGL